MPHQAQHQQNWGAVFAQLPMLVGPCLDYSRLLLGTVCVQDWLLGSAAEVGTWPHWTLDFGPVSLPDCVVASAMWSWDSSGTCCQVPGGSEHRMGGRNFDRSSGGFLGRNPIGVIIQLLSIKSKAYSSIFSQANRLLNRRKGPGWTSPFSAL